MENHKLKLIAIDINELPVEKRNHDFYVNKLDNGQLKPFAYKRIMENNQVEFVSIYDATQELLPYYDLSK